MQIVSACEIPEFHTSTSVGNRTRCFAQRHCPVVAQSCRTSPSVAMRLCVICRQGTPDSSVPSGVASAHIKKTAEMPCVVPSAEATGCRRTRQPGGQGDSSSSTLPFVSITNRSVTRPPTSATAANTANTYRIPKSPTIQCFRRRRSARRNATSRLRKLDSGK